MKTVLAVDDNPTFLQTYQRLVASKNHQFIGANNPLEALSIVGGGRSIDLMITDLNMPQLEGGELIARVHQVLPDTKYLLITARGVEVVNPILTRLRYQGVQVEYLPKSSGLLDISQAIDSQLN